MPATNELPLIVTALWQPAIRDLLVLFQLYLQYALSDCTLPSKQHSAMSESDTSPIIPPTQTLPEAVDITSPLTAKFFTVAF